MTSIEYVPRNDINSSSSLSSTNYNQSIDYMSTGISPNNGGTSPRSTRGPALSIDIAGANNGSNRGGKMVQQQSNGPSSQSPPNRSQQPQQQQHQQQRQQKSNGGNSYDDEQHVEDESPTSSGDEVANELRNRNLNNGGGIHPDDHEHDEVGEGEDQEDDSGSFSDSLSSSPSIPDEDIDFTLVYALHTFLATVDGQASVVKGDKLLLLDDSNSYWWLVRVLKTQAVGYIPAENIETPWERLARLNKHRNVDLTSATQQDLITGPNSTAAQTRFDGRIPPSQQPHPHESQHPSAKGILASPSHKDHPRNISPTGEGERSHSRKAKTVIFTAPTYYEHSANGDTEGEEEGDEGDDYDDVYEEEEGVGMDLESGEGGELGHDGQIVVGGRQVFEDDEDEGEESEFSDDHLAEEAERDGTGAVGLSAGQIRANGRQQQQQQQQQHQQHSVQSSSSAVTDYRVVHPDEGEDGGDEEDLSADRWDDAGVNGNQARVADSIWQQQMQQRALSPSQQQQLQQYQQQQKQQQQQQQQHQYEQRALSPQQQQYLYQQQQQQQRQQYEQQQQFDQQQQQQLRSASASAGQYSSHGSDQRGPQRRSSDPSFERRPLEPTSGPLPSSSSTRFADAEFSKNSSQPTKKLTATPPIVRDLNFDINNPFADLPGGVPSKSNTLGNSNSSNSGGIEGGRGVGGGPIRDNVQRVRGVEVVDPTDPRYGKLISEKRTRDEGPMVGGGGNNQYLGNSQASSNYSTGRRPSADSGNYNPEQEFSFNSVDTSSTGNGNGGGVGGSGGRRGSEDGPNTLSKKPRKSSGSGDEEKKEKKKSGTGILGGLFRKKDKKKKDDNNNGIQSYGDAGMESEDASRTSLPNSGNPAQMTSDRNGPSSNNNSSNNNSWKRESQTAESMFSTDAALRQQQVEAKQAMYHQYGVQRGPGDLTNQMTPRNQLLNNSSNPNFSPTTSTFGSSPNLQQSNSNKNLLLSNGRMRPGSLIGSPSIPGLEVPLLSVLRVFAGDNIESEATFKTVLLNHSTTSLDLVKQSMQRFRLAGLEDIDEYFLTVRELGGEERALSNEQKPLVIFEALSDTSGTAGFRVPSVKRSSVGSISSIASNLSLNPAITRLGMNDFSDDSAVKFYLNRRLADEPTLTLTTESDSMNFTELYADSAFNNPSTTTPTPSFRFAVKILIHPDDLPENVVFDPQSQAIIPKSVLLERQARFGQQIDSSKTSTSPREKIIFFPRNVNVSEVIEASLDRFGIVDGVVDGGDEVEDRISRRRSNVRVKYGLSVVQYGRESLLITSGRVLDAYTAPPLFKPYDRSSKEFRRRSVDATLILGTPNDIQPSDPIFVIRRAAPRFSNNSGGSRQIGLNPVVVDELALQQQQQQQQQQHQQQQQQQYQQHQQQQQQHPRSPQQEFERPPSNRSNTGDSAYSHHSANAEEAVEQLYRRAASPQATRQDVIAAQRAASQANQRAILSAQKNTAQGVDIVLPERGTVRSSRSFSTDRVRYSYIDPEGTETDISEIVESEWEVPHAATVRSDSRGSRRRPSDDSFESALASPASDGTMSENQRQEIIRSGEEDDYQAIRALRATSVNVDNVDYTTPLSTLRGKSSISSLRRAQGGDVFEDALGGRAATSPKFNESLQDRLDRVLAKVKDDKLKGSTRSRSVNSNNGRLSPLTTTSRSISPTQQLQAQGRLSPLREMGRDSPSIESTLRATPSPRSTSINNNHGQKPSLTSLSSHNSSPQTPISPLSHSNTSNNRSTDSRTSTNSRPMLYPADFGIETLMTIIDADSNIKTVRPEKDPGVDMLFGHSVKDAKIHPDVKSWYAEPSKALDDLDARLDALILRLHSGGK